MQKKSGYLSVKANTRKDKIKVFAGTSYIIDPYTQEGATFLGQGLGTVHIELPPAVAGRRFTFITDDNAALGGFNHIDIVPSGVIMSTDRIYDPTAAAYMQGGFSIINGAALAQAITLECHNDGLWSVKNIVGAWAQGDREFWVTVTSNSVVQNRFIGSSGDPAVVVDLYVKNDKYIVANMAAQHTQGDDLSAMTIGTRTYPGRDAEANWNHVRFPIGGTDEIIGRNVGESLLLDDGLSDVLIGATGVLSNAAVQATEAPILIAGLKANTMETASGIKVHTFVIDLLNDTFRTDITAAVLASMITFGGTVSGLVIDVDELQLSESNTRITIVTESGESTTGAYHIIISHAAFVNWIRNSGINQRLDGSLT